MGTRVGATVGLLEGVTDGADVGLDEGIKVGGLEGVNVGVLEGRDKGTVGVEVVMKNGVGTMETVGEVVGSKVGVAMVGVPVKRIPTGGVVIGLAVGAQVTYPPQLPQPGIQLFVDKVARELVGTDGG